MKHSTKFIHAGLCLALACMLASCLGGGSSTTTPLTPTLALFAGNMGGPGNSDGPVATARFDFPTGVATDNAGNVYVADSANSTIRKITPVGVVSTLAGSAGVSGSTDGTGAAARFYNPSGIATDSAGNVYVADTWNNTIRKITPAGVVSTLAGAAGPVGSADGSGGAASFSSPSGIAIDSAGNVFVADTGNNTIRKISPTGVVSTLAGAPGNYGSADGTGAAASFYFPGGVATDSAGNVFVADTGNNTIRKITTMGEVSTLAGTPSSGGYVCGGVVCFSSSPGVTQRIYGSDDGTGAAAGFNNPTGVATDSAGNVYVADNGNHTIRKITPDGVVSTLAGTPGVYGSADGTGAAANFYNPSGLATDVAGNVYVTDQNNHTIRKITSAGVVSTVTGTPKVSGSADGTGAAASFYFPGGVATDSSGNVFVADTGNHTIRKITPDGVVSTLAGTPGVYGDANGDGLVASFRYPTGVATDSTGNVYIVDVGSNTIRKVTPVGVVSLLAGNPGVTGSTDGSRAAASFYSPSGVATDSAGNVYVADSGNHTIRKITSDGVVSTLAGNPDVTGSTDGSRAAASFYSPSGVATDSAGNVYVTDYNAVRKITPTGVVITLAGTPGISGSADGTGAAARFNYPTGIATDSAGNIYVADSGNGTIRKITPDGVVSTVIGVAGVVGFTPGALPGALSAPRGIAISGTSLYITMYNGVAVVNNAP